MSASAHSSITPADSLAEESQAAQDLLHLLQQEQACLVEASIPQLESLTEQKSGLLTQLSALATQRHAALAAAGYQATESGMQYWVETQAPDAIVRQWESLLTSMRAAQETNRTNGLLIHTHLGHNQASLQALQSRHASGDNLYGPSGHSSTRLPGRGLVIG